MRFAICLVLIFTISNCSSIQSKLLCKMCHTFVHQVQKAESLTDPGIVFFLEQIAEAYCHFKKIEDKNVCDGAIQEMTPIIFEGIQTRFLDEDFLCPLLHQCPKVYQELKLEDYVENILQDKPENTEWPEIDGSETVDIIHVSDIHTDLLYKEGTKAQCTEPICCREDQGYPEEGEQAAGYWGSIAVCDLPERTLDQMIQFLKREVINPERDTYLFWTGDSVSHDIWKQSRDYNIENSKRITQMFTDAGLNIHFIPQVGNHEAFPVNEFDYMSERDNDFRVQFAEMWRHWIGDDNAEFFKQNGFYKQEYNDNFKVIAFDSQVCNPDNWFLLKDPTDPTNFLEWAESELRESEAKDQAVYFTAHIYTSSCLVPWARRFNALVERYSRIVRGQIYGHAHGEFFNLYKDTQGKAMNVAFISSSMTTYSNKQPSFRKFIVDKKTMIPMNYYEYRLDLKTANKLGANAQLSWDIAFDFQSEYGVKGMYPKDLEQLVERLADEPQLVKKFDFNSNSGTHYSGESTQHLYCKLSNSIDEDEKVCLGQTVKKQWTEYISPGWRKRLE